MFELFNGLMLDISPIYLYISIIVAVVSTYQLVQQNPRRFQLNNDNYLLNVHATEANLLPIQKNNITPFEEMNWILLKYTLSMNADDDTDLAPLHLIKQLLLRGGKSWNSLYSHF